MYKFSPVKFDCIWNFSKNVNFNKSSDFILNDKVVWVEI